MALKVENDWGIFCLSEFQVSRAANFFLVGLLLIGFTCLLNCYCYALLLFWPDESHFLQPAQNLAEGKKVKGWGSLLWMTYCLKSHNEPVGNRISPTPMSPRALKRVLSNADFFVGLRQWGKSRGIVNLAKAEKTWLLHTALRTWSVGLYRLKKEKF